MSSNAISTTIRQASRLCSTRPASIIRSSPLPSAIAASARRAYVTESKKDNAQVNVDTTIRADQKAFFAETGKRPQDVDMAGISGNADAMMSPMAGM